MRERGERGERKVAMAIIFTIFVNKPVTLRVSRTTSSEIRSQKIERSALLSDTSPANYIIL